MNFPINSEAFIEPPPEELMGVDLKVEFIGALAQAFKSIAANKIERVAGFVGQLAQAQPVLASPSPLSTSSTLTRASTSTRWRSACRRRSCARTTTSKAIREQREQAQQAQQMASMAAPLKDAAQAAKAASETKLGTGSALDAVAGDADQN
jgi:hypothetical protein